MEYTIVHASAPLVVSQEQPVLSAKGKRADRVFRQVVENRYYAVVQKCHKRLLLVQTVAHRFFHFAATRALAKLCGWPFSALFGAPP